jgi:hypothetical protein
LKSSYINKKNILQINILCDKIFNAEWYALNIEIIENLLEIFYSADIDSQTFFDMFYSILKKTNNLSVLSNIKQKMQEYDLSQEIIQISNNDFINWLCMNSIFK